MKRLFKKITALVLSLLTVAGLAGLNSNSVEPVIKAEAASSWVLRGSVVGWDSNNYVLELSSEKYSNFAGDPNTYYGIEKHFAQNETFKIFNTSENAWYGYSLFLYDKSVAQSKVPSGAFINDSNDNFKCLIEGTYKIYIASWMNQGDSGKPYGFAIDKITYEDTIHAGDDIYLKPVDGLWNQADAWFAVKFSRGTGSEYWLKMEEIGDDGIFKATAIKSNINVTFYRMNPEYTALESSSAWNYTSDLTFGGTENMYVIDGWSYGHWEEYIAPSKCTVTYTYLNETESEEVNIGESLTPNFINVEGYRFEGWFTDADFLTPFVKETVITVDTTLYGKYTAVESETYLIYVENTHNWEAVYAYTYRSLDNGNNSWPGAQLSLAGNSGYYYCELDVSESYDYIIFGNGLDEKDEGWGQTDNIPLGFETEIYVVGTNKNEKNKYDYSEKVVPSVAVAHIPGEIINVEDYLKGEVGSVTLPTGDDETVGISTLTLSKNGWHLVDEVSEDVDKNQIVLEYITKLDTCKDYENADYYRDLANLVGLDTATSILDKDYDWNDSDSDEDKDELLDVSITVEDKLYYMEQLKLGNKTTTKSLGSNLLSNITSSSNILMVLIVGLLGLTAVGAYYFLNKKKYAK